VPGYRLYRMNPQSGHIDGVEEFHSGDDVEAILLIQNRPRDVPVELWRDNRKVVRLDASPEVAARAKPRAAPEPSEAG
jgi:hypothetical protein